MSDASIPEMTHVVTYASCVAWDFLRFQRGESPSRGGRSPSLQRGAHPGRRAVGILTGERQQCLSRHAHPHGSHPAQPAATSEQICGQFRRAVTFSLRIKDSIFFPSLQ